MTRILLFAYRDFGFACLNYLLDQNEDVIGLFTHNDPPSDNIWYPSIAKLAKERDIPVYIYDELDNSEVSDLLNELAADLILSSYYRTMIPMKILNIAPLGAYNLHGSYLPAYRGCAPLNWAIINGEAHTGVTLHRMAAKADAGEIIAQEKISIGEEDTISDITKKAVDASVRVLDSCIDELKMGTAKGFTQDETEASYFPRRSPKDGKIDFNLHGEKIHNLVRALTHPYPGALIELSVGRILVWKGYHTNSQTDAEHGIVMDIDPLRITCKDGYFTCTHVTWCPYDSEVTSWQEILKISQTIRK